MTLIAFFGFRILRIFERKQKIENEHFLLKGMAVEKEPELNQSVNIETGMGSGGYIIFDMPDAKKSMFHDLLKGFEDYAKLRGYAITFSIDNSSPNKTAFKFTLDNQGINISSGQVREDLKNYINKVQKGESIDNMPMVLSPEEHSIVMTCLKNRINFLEHNLKLQKTGADFYKALMRQVSVHGLGIMHPQNIYIGDGNQAHTLQAINSPQAAVGTGNRLIKNQVDQSIHIANSFNERLEQLEALSDLWMELHRAREKMGKEDHDREKFDEAIENIRKVETELKEQDPPEPKRISRWLETAKNTLLTLALTEEVQEGLKKVLELFGMSS
jgi:hypothetical protein